MSGAISLGALGGGPGGISGLIIIWMIGKRAHRMIMVKKFIGLSAQAQSQVMKEIQIQVALANNET